MDDRLTHARIALAVAMALAAALLLWEGRHLTFFVDEWSFGFLSRHGMSPSELLRPDNGHLAAVPILLTKGSLEAFGADTTLPLRMVSIALHLAMAAMIFAFARRRLGPLASLAPAILFLFLGAGADAFAGSHSIPVQIAAASGIGALLAVSSERPGRDPVAAGLLLIGVLSNGFVLPFVAGVAAAILLDPSSRRSRLWVVAVPLAAYAAWWLGYGHDAESGFSIDNVGGLPAFAFDSLAAALAAVTGLFTEPGAEGISFQLGPGQALAGVVVAAALVLAVRGQGPPRVAWPALIALLALWIATGLVAGPQREPTSSRYVYPSVALLLIALAPIVAAVPDRRRASIALAAVLAVALLPNLREIHYEGNVLRTQASLNRAVLGAIDLTGPGVGAQMRIETAEDQVPGGVDDMRASVADYRRGRERYGTPAYSPAELEAADPGAREAADRTLGRVLGLRIEPAAGRARPLRPELGVVAENAMARRARGCVRAVPEAAEASISLSVPPRGVRIALDRGASAPVALRRFGDGFSVAAGAVVGGDPADLRLPAGASGEGWKLHLPLPSGALLCGL